VLKIAIASDLHIGDHARAHDLRPEPTTETLDRDYLKTFHHFVRRNRLEANYLVVPGDLSNRARPDEFLLGAQVISQLSNSLNVRGGRVLFVPGNHDVDWAVLTADRKDRSGVRRLQRYDPMWYTPLFQRILRRWRPTIVSDPYFGLWEFGNELVALALNTAWDDDPDVSVHHGSVSQPCIDALERHLASIDLSRFRLRLAIVHHHPLQYSDPIPEEPDFSVMHNAGNLLTLLRRLRFDLLIHGHKHAPNFGTHAVSGAHPLVVLGAGSFSVRLENRWAGLVSNQFHLLTIEGRDATSECVYGYLESWAYLASKGWVPSDSAYGIRHRIPFGTYVLPAQVRDTLRPLLVESFAAREYVEWTDVLRREPAFRWLPPDVTIDVLAELGRELNFRCHGDTPEALVLLKLRPTHA